MNPQPGITQFGSMFSGPFRFPSDGVAIGRPSASFGEEMQTMITFAGGAIDTGALYHENTHQWRGDHVTEAGYTMTFYKEGLATLAEFRYAARHSRGGCPTAAPPAPAGSASSSGSGSTPHTQRVAARTGRTSPGPAWPAPVSTPRPAPGRGSVWAA
jgi:hypothetical protein